MTRAVLIAALSGRALAEQARASGFAPIVVDLFADRDTRALALAARRADGDVVNGFEADSLVAALESLAHGRDPIGLVLGAGFEHRADLIDRLARLHTPLFCPAGAVRRVKYPPALAALCAAHAMPHPRISPHAPAAGDWLVKRAGAAGGAHVRPPGGPLAAGDYFQQRVSGEPVAALVLAGSSRATILGFSSQWADAAPGAPFRWGGAVRPAVVAPDFERKVAAFARAATHEAGLRGLVSFDFLVGADGFHLLEINPRPGATLDVFAERSGRLFAAHVAACLDQSFDETLAFDDAQAACTLYAPRARTSVAAVDWPAEAADLPNAGASFEQDDPVCTIRTRAESPAAARAQMQIVRDDLLARLGAGGER